MKILLIGGSGIISTDITSLALQRGEDITILNRGRHSLRFPDGCKIIIGDANDPAVGEQLAGQHFDVIADFVAFSANQLDLFGYGIFPCRSNNADSRGYHTRKQCRLGILPR